LVDNKITDNGIKTNLISTLFLCNVIHADPSSRAA